MQLKKNNRMLNLKECELYKVKDFETHFIRLLNSEDNANKVDKLLNMIYFSEMNNVISEIKVIESIMHVIEYIVKIIKKNKIRFKNGKDIIWDLCENIETGNNKVYQELTRFREKYYKIPDCKKKEWYEFKKEIINELETLFDNYDHYKNKDCEDDYDNNYGNESKCFIYK